MQIDSQYHREYVNREPVSKLAFRPVGDSTTPTSPTVDMSSHYLHEYLDRYDGKPAKGAQPKDHLKFKGPSVAFSSYNNEYPGFHGENQYVNNRLVRSNPQTDTLCRAHPSIASASTKNNT